MTEREARSQNETRNSGEFTIRLAITVQADNERDAWKIIDRVLNRPDDDEILTYTDEV